MGMALICRGSGTLNSRLSILDTLVTRLLPTSEARKAARKAVASTGSERSLTSRSWRSYSPETGGDFSCFT